MQKIYLIHRSLLVPVLFLLFSGITATSTAQKADFLLPLELYEGGTFVKGVDPFVFSTRLHPTWEFGDPGNFRAGGTVALSYTNPDWAVQYGLRIAFKVGDVSFEEVPAVLFYLGLEGLWESEDFLGTRNRGIVGPNFIIDTGSLRLGARAGRDYVNEAWEIGGWIGIDIIELFKLINPPDESDFFD